jgi:hypothetical protein
MAGRDRPGHRGRGVPGHRARHRPGRAGPAHLHHRAAVHAAGRVQARAPQAAADDLVGRRPGHRQPGWRAGCRGAVRRDRARAAQGLDHRADRHRRLRGRRHHRRRPDAGQHPGRGAWARRRLRLRADRHADEERRVGPVPGHRPVLHGLAALRDRRRRGRRAVLAAERPAGGLPDRRPAPAHPRRRADQLLLRSHRLQRERADGRLPARHRDRRRDRRRHRLHRAVPLPRPDARAPACGIIR